MESNWNELASRAAEHANDTLFEDHRGVMKWHGQVVIFGNDGYRQDERARLEVDLLRQHLSEAGIAELGFGLDERGEREDQGYTWAMVVESDDLDALHRMVWESNRVAIGAKADDGLYRAFRKIQGGDIADD